MSSTLTWESFVKECVAFQAIAAKLGDNWTLNTKEGDNNHFYLTYNQKISIPGKTENSGNEIVEVEYHIVYSLSYGVPMLLMNIYTDDGRRVDLERSWDIFFASMKEDLKLTRSDLLNMLTQIDHPILFRPFLGLHPCCTENILKQGGKSTNIIITFLSVMGPYVKIKLRNEYGLENINKE